MLLVFLDRGKFGDLVSYEDQFKDISQEEQARLVRLKCTLCTMMCLPCLIYSTDSLQADFRSSSLDYAGSGHWGVLFIGVESLGISRGVSV